MTKKPPLKDPATPGGKPLTVAPVAVPLRVYWMLSIGALIQTVWLLLPVFNVIICD